MSRAATSPYALAQGQALTGSPLVFSTGVRLGAEPAQVFGFISDFERLPQWLPLVKHCRVDNARAERPGQVGAVRVIEPFVGRTTFERVLAFEPARLLAYRASDASLMGLYRDHLSVLVTEAHAAGGTAFSWLVFARAGVPPMAWLGLPTFKYVVGRSVENLERRFPVQRVAA